MRRRERMRLCVKGQVELTDFGRAQPLFMQVEIFSRIFFQNEWLSFLDRYPKNEIPLKNWQPRQNQTSVDFSKQAVEFFGLIP